MLVRVERGGEVRERSCGRLGFAVRRGTRSRGSGSGWLRLAVRDRATVNRFLQALDQAVMLRGARVRPLPDLFPSRGEPVKREGLFQPVRRSRTEALQGRSGVWGAATRRRDG